MVALTVVGQTLTPGAKGVFNNAAASIPDVSETPSRPSAGLTPLVNGLKINAPNTVSPRDSDAWEVLDEHNASLIEEENEQPEPAHDSSSSNGTASSKASVASWKTAANGAALNEFASSACGRTSSSSEDEKLTRPDHDEKKEKPPPPRQHKTSFRSLASSIRRTASQAHRHLHKRTFSGSSVSTIKSPTVTTAKPRIFQSATLPSTPAKKQAFPTAGDEDRAEVLCPTPGPVGAQGTRRAVSASSAPSHHRTSTIRLVTSPYVAEENWDADELPLTGPNSVAQIKKRVVSRGPPAILEPAAKVSKVYPALPTFRVHNVTPKSGKSIPGAFPGSPTCPQSPNAMDVDIEELMDSPKTVTASKSFVGSPSIIGPAVVASPSKFVFGAGQQVSSTQFTDAGAKLLAEMQAKLGGAAFNPELLKGRKAEMSKLVSTNNKLGSGSGFGLSLGASTAATDRFAAAHQKEFSKMRSITDKKLAEASEPAEAGDKGKRKMEAAKEVPTEASNKRTKTAPKMLNKLRESVRGAPPPKVSGTPIRKRTSLRPESARKFALLRQKRASMAPVAPATTFSPPDPCTSDGEYVLAGGLRKTVGSSAAPQCAAASSAMSTASPLKASPAKKSSLGRKPLPDFGDVPPSTLEPIKDHSMGSTRSSASSTGSLSRSLRSRNLNRIASDNSLNKTVTRKASSSNLRALSRNSSPRRAGSSLPTRRVSGDRAGSSLPVRKVSAADSVKLAKKGSSESMRSRLAASTSSISAPTAASKARMQATVKPPGSSLRQSTRVVSSSKVLSSAPTTTSFGSFSVSSPFGEATSRSNVLGSGFHIGSPSTRSSIPVKSPLGGLTISHPRPLAPRTSAARTQGSSRAAMSPARRATMAKSPLKSPSKYGYAARTRTRESGISALKSPGGDVNQRRAEIRAKQERFKEEKELRAMLGA